MVVEGFYGGAVAKRASGRQSNELLRVFDRLRVTHYQDLTAPADWSGGQPAAIVRFVARKE